jgi:hypothetical protein
MQPVMSFEEASMPEYVLKEVLKQGFTERKRILFCIFIIIIILFLSIQLRQFKVKDGPWHY